MDRSDSGLDGFLGKGLKEILFFRDGSNYWRFEEQIGSEFLTMLDLIFLQVNLFDRSFVCIYFHFMFGYA